MAIEKRDVAWQRRAGGDAGLLGCGGCGDPINHADLRAFAAHNGVKYQKLAIRETGFFGPSSRRWEVDGT
jgi:hypothetical protein